jgi:alkaline phosphatase D
VSAALTRRQAVAAGAGALLAVDPVAAAAARRVPRLTRGVRFPTGVASGLPFPQGISLWTRADADAPRTTLRLEVARDPGFRDVVARRLVATSPERDGTVNVRLGRARWMAPGETYWYRFASRDGSSPVGRFRLARPKDSREPVRLGFWTCQAFGSGFYAAHRAFAAEEDLDAVVCLGDYVYEGFGRSSLAGRDVRPADGRDWDGRLEDYRFTMRTYRGDADLQALHAAHPMLVVWDDHELQNNYWREGASPGDAGDPQRRALFERRKAAAYRAWFENMPVPRIGGGSSTRIFRSVTFGALCEVVLLDSRQYRDPQPCGDDRVGEALLACDAAYEDGRRYLGPEQLAWCTGRLTASQAAWKVVGSPQMVMAQDIPEGQGYYLDTWDGYRAERRRLFEAVERAGAKDIVILSGDDHDHFAGYVTKTGRPGPPPQAVEAVVPALSSGTTGEPSLAEDPTTWALNAGRANNNPHLQVIDRTINGYAIVECRADELTIAIRSPSDRKDPQATVRTSYRYRVPRGVPGLEVVHRDR